VTGWIKITGDKNPFLKTKNSGIKIHDSFEDSHKILSRLSLNTWTKVECKGMNTGGDEGKILFQLNDVPKDSIIYYSKFTLTEERISYKFKLTSCNGLGYKLEDKNVDAGQG